MKKKNQRIFSKSSHKDKKEKLKEYKKNYYKTLTKNV